MVDIYRWFFSREAPLFTVPPADRSMRAGELSAWTVAVPIRRSTSQPTSRDITWPLDRVARV